MGANCFNSVPSDNFTPVHISFRLSDGLVRPSLPLLFEAITYSYLHQVVNVQLSAIHFALQIMPFNGNSEQELQHEVTSVFHVEENSIIRVYVLISIDLFFNSIRVQSIVDSGLPQRFTFSDCITGQEIWINISTSSNKKKKKKNKKEIIKAIPLYDIAFLFLYTRIYSV